MEIVAPNQLKNLPYFKEHHCVIKLSSPEESLFGYLSIYKATKMGCGGGTRVYPYSNEASMIKDSLRLSYCMNKKHELANSGLGGAKACLIPPKSGTPRKKWLNAYARELNKIEKNFYTGTDIGLSFDDASYLSKLTPRIVGHKHDTAFYTALFLFYQLKVINEFLYGEVSLSKRRFLIQGAGKVGSYLIELLEAENSTIIIHDIDLNKTKDIKRKFSNVKIIEDLYFSDVETDYFCPCAVGNIIEILKMIKCRVICGSANNQIENPHRLSNDTLDKIIYIPDHFASSGGLLSVIEEIYKSDNHKASVFKKIDTMCGQLKKLLNESKKTKQPIFSII